MHISVIDTQAGFEALRKDWEAIYDADPEAQFFLSWEWMSGWLNIGSTPWVILAAKRRPSDRRCVALLPLRLRVGFDETHGFFNQLSFAGEAFCDYTGLLVRPQDAAEAIPAIARHIRHRLNWARLRIDNLVMSEARRRMFLSAFEKASFTFEEIDYFDAPSNVDHGICPSIRLPGDWDAYLETLSANNRQKIRRLLRKVEASDTYRITLSGPESFERDLAILLDFWRTKWAPMKGRNTQSIIDHNRHMLRFCAGLGDLFMPIFWHGERPIAVLASLVDQRKRALLFAITGRDETYDEIPAGYVLHAYSIRHAIASGFVTYDFLKGNEPYKYLFAPQERRLEPLTVATRSGANIISGEMDPRCMGGMLQVARELEDEGKTDQAHRAYQQILEQEPSQALAAYRWARSLVEQGDYVQARALLWRSVQAEPDGDNAWVLLGRTLEFLGQEAEAIHAYRKALEVRPDHEEARRQMLRLSFAQTTAARTSGAGLSRPGLAVQALHRQIKASLGPDPRPGPGAPYPSLPAGL
jgi:CelD/BcsL family acetyltransferase involved in cellulose biosynthesis